MGSSVIHGGISTFLAIVVLGGARSYIFVVFFKLWFGIIVFGMSNGFILLPVILSLIGPTHGMEKKIKSLSKKLAADKAAAGDKDNEISSTDKNMNDKTA